MTGESFELNGQSLRGLGYGYDGADRQVQVVDDGQTILDKTYTNGQLASTTYGNGLTRNFVWRGPLLVKTQTITPGGFPVSAMLVSFPDCDPDLCWDIFASAATIELEYSRLSPDPTVLSPGGVQAGTRVTRFDNSSGGILHSYNYDSLGNMEIVGGGFGFNTERNRLLTGLGHSYSYDAAGFVTERDGVPVSWHASGLLASLGSDVFFVWDAEGRPVGSSVAGVGTVLFRFGGRVQADSNGNPMALSIGNEVSIKLATNEHLYRLFDTRGNVKFVLDDTGSVVQQYNYSAYRVEAVYGTGSDRRSFAQGLELGESGLIWLGARIYDPDVGRFLSPDPLYQIISQHTYTPGNPLWYWDPGGETWGASSRPIPSTRSSTSTATPWATRYFSGIRMGPMQRLSPWLHFF